MFVYFSFTRVRFWISGGSNQKQFSHSWMSVLPVFYMDGRASALQPVPKSVKTAEIWYYNNLHRARLYLEQQQLASYSHISFHSSSSQCYFLAICWIVLSLRDIKMKLNLMSRMCNREILPVCALQSSNCSEQIVFIEHPAGSNLLCARLQSRSNKSFIVRHHFLRAAWFL